MGDPLRDLHNDICAHLNEIKAAFRDPGQMRATVVVRSLSEPEVYAVVSDDGDHDTVKRMIEEHRMEDPKQ